MFQITMNEVSDTPDALYKIEMCAKSSFLERDHSLDFKTLCASVSLRDLELKKFLKLRLLLQICSGNFTFQFEILICNIQFKKES